MFSALVNTVGLFETPYNFWQLKAGADHYEKCKIPAKNRATAAKVYFNPRQVSSLSYNKEECEFAFNEKHAIAVAFYVLSKFTTENAISLELSIHSESCCATVKRLYMRKPLFCI